MRAAAAPLFTMSYFATAIRDHSATFMNLDFFFFLFVHARERKNDRFI